MGTLRVQKGSWARNGPFPFKNGFFLVYSTIAEIRTNLTISCRSGGETALWWGDPAVVGPFRAAVESPLCWGDPAVVGRPRCGSKRAAGPETARFLLKTAISWSTAQ